MSFETDVKYEENVRNVLNKDGIEDIDLMNENQRHTKFASLPKCGSWAKRIIYNDTFAAHVICQKPGETNRTHFHKDHDEWWVVWTAK